MGVVWVCVVWCEEYDTTQQLVCTVLLDRSYYCDSLFVSSFHSREYLIPESNAGDNSGLLFIIAVANAAIFIVIVIIMTVILVLLFKYRCYKVGVASLNI